MDELNMRDRTGIASKGAAAEYGERKRVYIIHGYGASPTSHWFPWLKKKVEKDGVTVEIPEMPDPLVPELGAWERRLSETLSEPDHTTYFVAHSLGCITLLRWLQGMDFAESAGGIVLVSGFLRPLPTIELSEEFFRDPLDAYDIERRARLRTVISAKDDPIVPHAFSRKMAEHIHAEFRETETGGHYLDQEGHSSLPPAYEVLTSMMRGERGKKA